MANIGAEVGQKMRSAIKAKLLELNCYVDDELPDYIMVMVANKRTKSQMKEDLQLFLTTKTATFVDWLHIVLKKLKEVTVTNPEVYKKTLKRKIGDAPNVDVKKEKKDKKCDKKEKKVADAANDEATNSTFKSLTDDLPMSANKLSEQRKIIIMKENQNNNSEQVLQDNFDIPPLSAVNMSTEEELESIERKIKNVKSRLGLLVESEEEEDYINLKAEPDELFNDDRTSEAKSASRKILLADDSTPPESSDAPKRSEHARITFTNDEGKISAKRKSILERLGKRRSQQDVQPDGKVKRSKFGDVFNEENSSKSRRSEEKGDGGFRLKRDAAKEGVLSRLGVMSKVSVPQKPPEESEEPFKEREVPSMVKIKPRVIPPDAPQANKNLLLKAVAEAQRSIAQTPAVGLNAKPDALFTKKYKEKKALEKHTDQEQADVDDPKPKTTKNKPRVNFLSDRTINLEYIPAPVTTKSQSIAPQYIPTSSKSPKSSDDEESLSDNGKKVKQQFIVTLDGIEKTKFKDLKATRTSPIPSIKSRLDKRKSPSPIIFDKVSTTVKTKSNIPDKLPLVHAPPSIKNKERCKYWPSCRHGDKCEFVHPSISCDMFPKCRFGDKCLYFHPSCKFGSSCTRRDCPYSHSPGNKIAIARITAATPAKPQTCKFFPNCTNPSCSFYHPKPCKFGKYCKNQLECSFSHSFVTSKSNLTWRPK